MTRTFEFPALLSDYTEGEWQSVIEEAASYYGFLHRYHTGDSRKSDRGFPDLCLVNAVRGQVVYFEVKTDKKRSLPTIEQVDWVRAFRCAGVHAWIVRPRDVDFVHGVLRGTIPPPLVGGDVLDITPYEGALLNEARTKSYQPPRRRRTTA